MKVRALIAGPMVMAIAAMAAGRAGAENRLIDGSGNNLVPIRRTWGAAETDVIRFGYAADYPDGFGDAIDGSPTVAQCTRREQRTLCPSEPGL